MSQKLTLYTRRDCCLCEEMRQVIRQAKREFSLEVEEIDVDSAPDLRQQYGEEVPVLFINGRKAFKYRAALRDLRTKLRRE